MEKFNAIKILEEELEEKNLFDKNLSKEDYMKSVYKFVDDYVEPILKKELNKLNLQAPEYFIDEIKEDVLNDKNISEEDKEKMLKVEIINLFYNDRILSDLVMQTTFIVNDLGFIDKDSSFTKQFFDDDIATFLEDDEIGFLGKEKKIKVKVANKLCESIILMLKDELSDDTKH